MTNFFIWMQRDQGWKSMLALVYAMICIFDFVVVPIWIGASHTRLDLALIRDSTIPLQIQLELIRVVYQQHQPFTLQGGGLFHLAFGALLTGSALSKSKDKSTD
jgi:hypothetical protein